MLSEDTNSTETKMSEQYDYFFDLINKEELHNEIRVTKVRYATKDFLTQYDEIFLNSLNLKYIESKHHNLFIIIIFIHKITKLSQFYKIIDLNKTIVQHMSEQHVSVENTRDFYHILGLNYHKESISYIFIEKLYNLFNKYKFSLTLDETIFLIKKNSVTKTLLTTDFDIFKEKLAIQFIHKIFKFDRIYTNLPIKIDIIEIDEITNVIDKIFIYIDNMNSTKDRIIIYQKELFIVYDLIDLIVQEKHKSLSQSMNQSNMLFSNLETTPKTKRYKKISILQEFEQETKLSSTLIFSSQKNFYQSNVTEDSFFFKPLSYLTQKNPPQLETSQNPFLVERKHIAQETSKNKKKFKELQDKALQEKLQRKQELQKLNEIRFDADF